MDSLPQTKQSEQYPLLKVESGGGDVCKQSVAASTIVSPGWVITCKPPKSWTIRWPEFISACWMTLILLGMSFLVLYALGIDVFRRQHVILYKLNSSNPASNVFLHHITQEPFVQIRFQIYTESLSIMATRYPSLNFHVYFLVDDSLQAMARGPRRRRFNNKLIPFQNLMYIHKNEISSKQDPNYSNFTESIKEFQSNYENVQITIMNLSNYMEMTPLKYYWKNIPVSYLPFYARLYSVWQNSGVGIDLLAFNNRFVHNRVTDQKLNAILKQHNDGIKPEEYVKTLNKISREEENEVFSMIFGLINFIMNETKSIISSPFVDKNMTRNKQIRDDSDSLDISFKNNTQFNDANKTSASEITIFNATTSNTTANISDSPQITYISIISDGFRPVQFLPESGLSNFDSLLKSPVAKHIKHNNEAAYLLAIDPEGTYLSASTRMHPFLRHLLFSACHGLPPRFAIQDAFMVQCPHSFSDDLYCSNIYFL